MKRLQIALLLFLLIAGIVYYQFTNSKNEITPKTILSEIEKGNFTNANMLINKYIINDSLSGEELCKWNYQKKLMNRIKIDFSQSKEEITDYLKHYYPNLKDSIKRKWESKNYLEMRIIDGKRRYFKKAGSNLFRINTKEKKHKIAVDGNQINSLAAFCKIKANEVIQATKTEKSETVGSKSFIINYKLSVKANVVPENEIIRCWLPYPRLHKQRLPEIEFISANPEEYIIADKSKLQHSIYMEKRAKKDTETVFEIKYKIKTSAQWFNIKPENIKPYDKSSKLYKLYTAERIPHVVFTKEIKKLTDSIVGKEQNPYKIVHKIYTWIDDNIPWASALEYGIINNIPEYVLKNRHGDCGMQTLLFMTMAKYKGIPVKWQSGWMLHPDNVNLHDWAEVYYEGIGWIPVDQSFSQIDSDNPEIRYFYTNGIDAYRLIINDDYARNLYPAKTYPRSEPYDFQRGEIEWRCGNLYFDKWSYKMEVEYLN